jgi:phosphatidylglycerophosphate synthase
MIDAGQPREFVILADESAGWHIAGLRQLDRLLLAVNEFASTQNRPRVRIFWKDGIDSAYTRTAEARFIDIEPWSAGDPIPREPCILSTHLCMFRNGLNEFCSQYGQINSELMTAFPSWSGMFEEHKARCQSVTDRSLPWRFVATTDAIDAAERALLKSANKAQDGFVSIWINRPISRLVARQLLRFPVRPDQFTFAILALPLIAAAFLVRGNYAGVVIGAALFQLFSILDGCDGEIARAKYLDSPKGATIDRVCDHIGNIFFLTGLSIGLYRQHDDPSGQRYLLEGIVCAIVITLHELVLSRWQDQRLSSHFHMPSAYQRHRGMLEHSGIAMIGAKRVGWVVQLTKRDVAIVVFLILAILGRPQWIIHLWLAVTLGSVLLTGIAMARSARVSTP